MRVIIRPDYDKCSVWAANYIAYKINGFRPTAERPFVLGLPTGSTPLGTYRELIKLYQVGKLSFENVITFNMDEYIGLDEKHPQSYHYFMWENFFKHINIKKENINMLNGMTKDYAGECRPLRRKNQSLRRYPAVSRRCRFRRPYRFQRTRLVAKLAHPRQNPYHRNSTGQFALF